MKSLNDFIRDNAQRFHTEEPPDGHFERFNARLGTMPYEGKTRYLTAFSRIAAVLIIGLFLAATVYLGLSYYRTSSSDDSCPNKELCEAEDYYSRQIDKYYQRIEKLPFSNDPQTRDEILKELREMDNQVARMKEDLKQNPNDERVVHSIINFYQNKIDLMDMIIVRTNISENSML
jgi:predicted ribosome quality control (RQC) complex YloA/Tae2 family protein